MTAHLSAVPPLPDEPDHNSALFVDELSSAHMKIANLEIALTTSRRIGMAMGIIMRDQKCTEDAAFDVLRTASQQGHRKLRDVAEDVVSWGTLLG